jgi:hypothetical protein
MLEKNLKIALTFIEVDPVNRVLMFGVPDVQRSKVFNWVFCLVELMSSSLGLSDDHQPEDLGTQGRIRASAFKEAGSPQSMQKPDYFYQFLLFVLSNLHL